MTTSIVTRSDHPVSQPPPHPRESWLKMSLAAWAIGVTTVTAFWVVHEQQAHGSLRSFGHEGDPGQWNPTLWAVIVGVWSLIVGIQALRAHYHRGRTPHERIKLEVSSWLLGMSIATPLWALIEWQDNGAFERLSNNSGPGDWDPWFLYVGGIWAAVVAFRTVRAVWDRDVG